MKVSKGTYKGALFACRHYHYSHQIPVTNFIYNVWNDKGEWCGVIIYSPGANPNIAMPYDMWQGQVFELVRVALNGKQGHGRTSEAVAMSLKMLKKEAPWIDLVVSYADMDQAHMGIIYQATNWIYVGETEINGRGAFIIFGKKMHTMSVGKKGWRQSLLWLKENVDENAEIFKTKGKRKYLYPMNKKIRRRINILAKPYPKKND